jgi:hypothetical protein
MKDERYIIAEQFAEDYLLVVDNDLEMFEAHLDKAKDFSSVASLSDVYREGYDNLTGQVYKVVKDNISEEAATLVLQLLGNTGSLPFDFVAKHYLNKVEELANA